MVRYAFWGQPAVKDAIEAQGVPHPEVDLVLVNGTPVDFDRQLRAGDRVSVYPWLQSLPGPEKRLRPPLPSPLRFVCDVHLGQLARYLRMLGMNTRYDTNASDATLAQISGDEDRVLLTRDVGLLKRSRVQLGLFIRPQAPRRQGEAVVQRVRIADHVDPLSRCLSCNTELQSASPEAIDEQVPPRVRAAHHEFVQCPSCHSVYWDGTHVDRMRRLIGEVTHSTHDDADSLPGP